MKRNLSIAQVEKLKQQLRAARRKNKKLRERAQNVEHNRDRKQPYSVPISNHAPTKRATVLPFARIVLEEGARQIDETLKKLA